MNSLRFALIPIPAAGTVLAQAPAAPQSNDSTATESPPVKCFDPLGDG